MEKKTTKRKTTIITLSDHNKEEIRNIDFQKQNMEEEFNQKKIGVYCIFSMGGVIGLDEETFKMMCFCYLSGLKSNIHVLSVIFSINVSYNYM